MRHSSLLLLLFTAFVAAGGNRSAAVDRYLHNPLPVNWNVPDSSGVLAEAGGSCDTQWWRGFDDPLLDSLIALGREANYDLAAAATRMAVAKAQLGQARAAYFPALTLSAGYSRERVSGRTSATAVPASTSSVFAGSVDMSWEIDVFGKITRQVRQRKAQVQVSAAEYAAALNALDAQIASTYIGLLASREQLGVARSHAASQQDIMNTTLSRFECGLASKLDVTQARTLYYSTVAQIPMLEASIAASVNALGVLLGVDASQLPAGVMEARPLPDCHRLVQLCVPAELLRRRPDIVEAEKSIDAAAAALGIARGQYLPSLTLQGSIGTEAHRFGDLFSGPSLTYSIAPTLSWTIFDGLGRRYAAVEASESLRAAVDSYNLTVLTAIEEVRNAATRYDSSLRYIATLQQVVANANESTVLSYDLYREGLTPFINVDNAELSCLEYDNTLITAKADALSALIDLFKALGGAY